LDRGFVQRYTVKTALLCVTEQGHPGLKHGAMSALAVYCKSKPKILKYIVTVVHIYKRTKLNLFYLPKFALTASALAQGIYKMLIKTQKGR
jgi:hypothetical protein